MKTLFGILVQTFAVLAVSLLTSAATAQTAPTNAATATREFNAFVNELDLLNENGKFESEEWDEILMIIRSMPRMKGKSDEARVEILQATTEKIITLIEGEQEETEQDEKDDPLGDEELQQAERRLEKRAQELEAKERWLAEQFEQMEAKEEKLRQEMLRRRERAPNERAENLEGDGLQDLFDGLKSLEGIELDFGELGLDVDQINEEMADWAEKNAEEWSRLSQRLGNSAGDIGQLIEQMNSEELEPWADDFAEKMGAWVEKLEGLESGEFDGDEIAGLIEDNLKAIGELPLRELYRRAQNEFENSDLLNEESVDELGLMIFRSVNEAMSIVEENGGKESLQAIEEAMGELFDENGEADAKALLFGLLKSAERANKPRRAKRARGADRDSGGRKNKIEALEKQMKAMQRELERLQEDNRP